MSKSINAHFEIGPTSIAHIELGGPLESQKIDIHLKAATESVERIDDFRRLTMNLMEVVAKLATEPTYYGLKKEGER